MRAEPLPNTLRVIEYSAHAGIAMAARKSVAQTMRFIVENILISIYLEVATSVSLSVETNASRRAIAASIRATFSSIAST